MLISVLSDIRVTTSVSNAALVYESVVLRLKAESAGETSLWSELAKAAEEVVSESPGVESLDRFRALTDQPVVKEALSEVEAGSRKAGYWNDLDYEAGVHGATAYRGFAEPLPGALR